MIMERLVRVGITHGDINGIGYEVILKALADERVTELFTPVIFGSAPLVEKCRADLGIEDFSFECVEIAENAAEGQIYLVDIGCDGFMLTPGVSAAEDIQYVRGN